MSVLDLGVGRPPSLINLISQSPAASGIATTGLNIHGNGVSVSPGGGSAVVGSGVTPGQPVGSAVVQSTVNAGIFKTREMQELNFGAAGDSIEIEMGQVTDILDLSGTRLAVDAILMITPDGGIHDLASLCRTRAEYQFIPAFPPGKYYFQNTSGGALSSKKIFFHGVDKR